MATARKTILAIAALCILLVVTIVATALNTLRIDAAAEVISTTNTSAQPKLGETFTTTSIVRLPWHRRVTDSPVFSLPPGLQLASTPPPKPISGGLGHIDWRVEVNLQCVDFGPFEAQEATLPLSPRRDGSNGSILLTIPGLSPPSRFEDNTPQTLLRTGALAAPIPIEEPPPRWPWVLAAISAICLLLAILLKPATETISNKPAPPPRPPWDIAQEALQQLEQSLPMQPDLFFVRLIDVLRRYLEAAFHLRATEQTTVEFLQAMQAAPNLLSQDHSALLEEVIRAADVVKFARTGATDEQLLDALKKGQKFIIESADALRTPVTSTAPDE